MGNSMGNATKVTVTIHQLAQAFEAWENGFRADPSKYMTTEECAAANVSTISADRAAYLMGLIEAIAATGAVETASA